MERITADDIVKIGLGTMLIAKEKVEGFIDEAIQQGDISKEEGEKLLGGLKEQAQEKTKMAEKNIQNEIHRQLKEMGLATKEDIASLKHEITALKHLMQK